MIAEAEQIGDDGLIQVQANRYEGFTVWATAMIESAGAQILNGPDRGRTSSRRRPRRRSR